jgi:hypothetical protein
MVEKSVGLTSVEIAIKMQVFTSVTRGSRLFFRHRPDGLIRTQW